MKTVLLEKLGATSASHAWTVSQVGGQHWPSRSTDMSDCREEWFNSAQKASHPMKRLIPLRLVSLEAEIRVNDPDENALGLGSCENQGLRSSLGADAEKNFLL